MYDWPERRAETDALWMRLAGALRRAGFNAPGTLTRRDRLDDMWLRPDLLLGETCTHPLETVLRGRVRYVATPVRGAPGCGRGTYRSVIVARLDAPDLPPPDDSQPQLPDRLDGRLAINEAGSMSGHVALRRDLAAAGRPWPGEIVETGAHRASIRAVASGTADIAAIDCVTWRIARAHEPAARALAVIGWTAERPGLPLITNGAMTDADIERLRKAIACVMPIVIH